MIEDDDMEINSIFDDIQTFLDCPSWNNFCSSLSNAPIDQKTTNGLISSIISKVSKGVLQPSVIFTNYNISALVDSFILNPDPNFFNIASYLLNDIKNCTSLPFFELLIQKSPQIMISMINRKDSRMFTQYVRILTRSYVLKTNHFISEALCKYQLTLVIRELFLTISNLNSTSDKYNYNYESETNSFDTTSTVSLLFELWKTNNKKNNLSKYYSALKSESTIAFEFHSDNVINSILDFIQFGSDQKIFDYSIVFGDIYGKTSNQYFVAILLERMNNTPLTVFQSQLELIDKEAARPLREEMRKSVLFQKNLTQNPLAISHSKITDNELLSLSSQFIQKGSIPQKIAQLHMFEKSTLINKVAPDLRRLSKLSSAAKSLLETLEKRKMIPVVKEAASWMTIIETFRDTDSTMSQFAEASQKARPTEFAQKFFDSFNKALYLRHSEDVKVFCDKVSEIVISKLNGLREFTKTAVSFLNGCLCEQHRKSLSLIAVRCPLHEFIESDIFNSKKEVQILNDLHEAAVIGCSYLTASQKNLNRKAVYFDPLLILRLRWRCLRGDFAGNLPWLPEFSSLIDDDTVKFLIWECNEVGPEKVEKRRQILAKLGLMTNFKKVPKILHHLLSMESPSKYVVEGLIPVLLNCPIEKVSLSEKVNISVLFQISSILWSKPVMTNPCVLGVLRDKPPVSVSQALLMSFNSNSYNFVCFPIGFYALIVNSNELVGEKPPILICLSEIIQCLQKVELFEIPENLPKYAKISLVAFLARRNFPLNRFFDHDGEFASYCIFFSICLKKFDQAVLLLKSNVSIVSCLLDGFDDGYPFVGAGCWKNSLIEFAIYCAASQVAFDSPDWASFVSLIYKANWPSNVCNDQSNFVLFSGYMKMLGITQKV